MDDILDYGIKIVICGTAIGNATHRAGHYYANSSNQFWNTLYITGLTPYRLQPFEDTDLLNYSIGITDIAKNQYGNDNILNFNHPQIDEFKEKIIKYQPRVLCFNGKKAAKVFFNNTEVSYGLCNSKIGNTFLFIAPSTSGSARRFWDINYWHDVAKLSSG